MSAETRAKISAAKTGVARSPETRAKMSSARKGISFWTDNQRAKQTARLTGRVKTPEERAKLSASNMGHAVSEKTRAAVAAANRVREVSPESRAKSSAGIRLFWKNATPEKRAQRAEYARQNLLLSHTRRVPKTTKPERIMAERLQADGVLFEAQFPIAVYLVDFYLPDSKTVIEVNGCYWHGCAPCGFGEKNKKVQANDRRKVTYLANHGYALRVVWEHELVRRI